VHSLNKHSLTISPFFDGFIVLEGTQIPHLSINLLLAIAGLNNVNQKPAMQNPTIKFLNQKENYLSSSLNCSINWHKLRIFSLVR
jgi:hypothetical protein